jgi:hypothetical protein
MKKNQHQHNTIPTWPRINYFLSNPVYRITKYLAMAIMMTLIAVVNLYAQKSRIKNEQAKIFTNADTTKPSTQNLKRIHLTETALAKNDFSALRNGDYSIVKLKLPGNTAALDYFVQKWGTKLILNGDIIVQDFALFTTRSYTEDDTKPTFGKDELYRWPGGDVPVVIDNSVFEGNSYNIIKSALDFFNFNTGIVFKQRTNEDNYVTISCINNDGSGRAGSSDVGRQRNGSNNIVLIRGSFSMASVLHELLHTLGVWHEQSRADRDNFIQINLDNVIASARNNFQIESNGTARSAYDYCSIMEYPAVAFAVDPTKPTILCKTNGVVSACPECLGQRVTLSKQDLDGLDAYYREIGVSRFPSKIPFVPSNLPHFMVPTSTNAKKIAAVSRMPNTMETFWIGEDGSVWDANWYEGANWGNFQIAPAGSASGSGGIAAVSRMKNTMEIWWIGANGSLQDAYWYEGGKWSRQELAPAGSASLTGNITAVSRIQNSMEVWWVGANGSLQDAFWYEGGKWNRQELAPPGSASVSTGIAAVSRVPTSMELWFVGANGSMQDAYWYEGGKWNFLELAPAGSASLSTGIAAVSRVPKSMELWFAGANGSLQDAYWYEGGKWNRQELAPAGSASLSTGISAVARIPSSMEVWYVGTDGGVKGNIWKEGGSWKAYDLTVRSEAKMDAGIKAISRTNGSIELWWSGFNGSLSDAYWYEGSGWKTFQLASK